MGALLAPLVSCDCLQKSHTLPDGNHWPQRECFKTQKKVLAKRGQPDRERRRWRGLLWGYMHLEMETQKTCSVLNKHETLSWIQLDTIYPSLILCSGDSRKIFTTIQISPYLQPGEIFLRFPTLRLWHLSPGAKLEAAFAGSCFPTWWVAAHGH